MIRILINNHYKSFKEIILFFYLNGEYQFVILCPIPVSLGRLDNYLFDRLQLSEPPKSNFLVYGPISTNILFQLEIHWGFQIQYHSLPQMSV